MRTLSVLLSCLPFVIASAATYEGQVIIRNPDTLVVKSPSWTGWVRIDKCTDTPCREGDLVRINGKTVSSPYQSAETVIADAVEICGHDKLPATLDVPGGRIADGSLEFEFVRTRGIVASVSRGYANWNWVVLRSPNGDFGVSIREKQHSYESLRALIDAEVSVRGIVVYSWSDKNNIGAHLSLRGDGALKVLVPAPNDPFSAPALNKVRRAHRQTVRGTVVATGSDTVMIRTDAFGTIQTIPSKESALPSLGRVVTAAGFAKADPINLLLAETLYRDEGPGVPDDSTPIQPNPRYLPTASYHGHVIAVTGIVRGNVTTPDRTDVLTLDCEGTSVLVDVSALRGALREYPVRGSVLRATGFCVVTFENASPTDAFPRFRNVTVLPRTPSDLALLAKPPWWTPGRLLAALGIVLAGLIGACVWVGALHRLSERRGRELFKERQAHEADRVAREISEVRMRDRTRLAVELHDTISQTLTGATMQLGTAAEFASTDSGQALAHLEIATRALDSCREEIRNCIWDLRNNALDIPDLNEAIRQTIQRHVNGARIRIRFNIAREKLSDNTVHALIRIVRELATNAARHGNAKTIRIAGSLDGNMLRFSVADDGCGFDPDNHPGLAEGHFGLQGIEERVAELDGAMAITNRPGGGMNISIRMKAT